jgi:hypothetical protein
MARLLKIESYIQVDVEFTSYQMDNTSGSYHSPLHEREIITVIIKIKILTSAWLTRFEYFTALCST